MENPIGNSTTIVNTIILMLAGIIFGKWGATLLQLGIDRNYTNTNNIIYCTYSICICEC